MIVSCTRTVSIVRDRLFVPVIGAYIGHLSREEVGGDLSSILASQGNDLPCVSQLVEVCAPKCTLTAHCGPHAGCCFDFIGGPERARTSDLRFRKPLLYPTELRDHQ